MAMASYRSVPTESNPVLANVTVMTPTIKRDEEDLTVRPLYMTTLPMNVSIDLEDWDIDRTQGDACDADEVDREQDEMQLLKQQIDRFFTFILKACLFYFLFLIAFSFGMMILYDVEEEDSLLLERERTSSSSSSS